MKAPVLLYRTPLSKPFARWPPNLLPHKRWLCLECRQKYELKTSQRQCYIWAACKMRHLSNPARVPWAPSQGARRLATVAHGIMHSSRYTKCATLTEVAENPKAWGPLDEYDERVHSHRLRDDEHQRSTDPLGGSPCARLY